MIFKEKLKELLTFGTLNISASMIFSIFWLYLASVLEKEEYGELGFLMSIVNVGNAISLMGYNSVVVVYEPKKENVFPASFLLVLISANITAALTFVVTQNLMVSVLIVGIVIFNIILSGLNGHQRFKDFSLHRIIRAVMTVILVLILYQYFGINGILLGYFLSTLLIFKELNSLIKNRKMDFSLLKRKTFFMLNAFAMRLTEVFIRWGDKIIIGGLFGFSILGSYYVAVQYLILLLTIPQSLATYLIPQESTGTKNKKIKIFSILISCLIVLVSIIVIPHGVNAFLPKYEESIIPMQILSIAIIPFTIASIQESEFFGKENSRIVLYSNSLQSGFYILSIIFLGQAFGLHGMSIGLVLAAIIRMAFNFIMKNKIKYNSF